MNPSLLGEVFIQKVNYQQSKKNPVSIMKFNTHIHQKNKMGHTSEGCSPGYFEDVCFNSPLSFKV